MTDFAAKMRMASEALGCKSHKELFSKLGRACPDLKLNVDQGYKWVQGKSSPRDIRVYQTLAELLELDEDGHRLRYCSLEDFRKMLVRRHTDHRDAEALTHLAGTYATLSRSRFPGYPDQINYGRIECIETPQGDCEIRYLERSMGRVQSLTGSIVARGGAFFSILTSESGDMAMSISLTLPLNTAQVVTGYLTAQRAPEVASSMFVSPLFLIRAPDADHIKVDDLGLVDGTTDTVADILTNIGYTDINLPPVATGLVTLVQTDEGFQDMAQCSTFSRSVGGPISGMTARWVPPPGANPNRTNTAVLGVEDASRPTEQSRWRSLAPDVVDEQANAEQLFLKVTLDLDAPKMDWALCLKRLERAIDLNPDWVTPRANAAGIWFSARMARAERQISPWTEIVREWIEDARRMAPEEVNDGSFGLMIKLAIDGGSDPDEIVSRANKLLRRRPFDQSSLYWSGRALAYVGDAHAARSALLRALHSLRMTIYEPFILAGLAQANLQLEEDRTAIQYANAAIRLRANNIAAWRALAAAYAHLGQTDKANSAVTKLLDLIPDESVGAIWNSARYSEAPGLTRYREGLLRAGLPK